MRRLPFERGHRELPFAWRLRISRGCTPAKAILAKGTRYVDVALRFGRPRDGVARSVEYMPRQVGEHVGKPLTAAVEHIERRRQLDGAGSTLGGCR